MWIDAALDWLLFWRSNFIMIHFGSPERDYSLPNRDTTLEKGLRSQHSKDVQLHDSLGSPTSSKQTSQHFWGKYKTWTPGPWTTSVDRVHGLGPSKYGPAPWTTFMDRLHGPPIFGMQDDMLLLHNWDNNYLFCSRTRLLIALASRC